MKAIDEMNAKEVGDLLENRMTSLEEAQNLYSQEVEGKDRAEVEKAISDYMASLTVPVKAAPKKKAKAAPKKKG